MEINEHYEKAVSFKELHHHSLPLLLPNAWDAMSAIVFEQCGFKAIGTTSAGIAASLGYADAGRTEGAYQKANILWSFGS
ncbi:hypothetical protein EHS13_06375 [Paenibacillus psychroresistens]|uniref:Isocitrate lyase/phosphoenolpyruvate mutase family protein n=1 Tax=Paenibacillus psychroresistens TaxID=1778678 RepID=A0A6B8RGI8_9BACL|nr:hypothetical protein EHS13_06375 [Paenibacillus psychroresistens]